ncbi:uncharacterized protein LOC113318106 isoform X2 [Papaver somniferum]|uniref:uncharacterized protein LOC113318106 isoform X2 n=1 Tax=Papaver somniferum TaxID=3469 RepID=UPI000E6F7BD1|nr:uncharacterized protein LOC113318106 isoform X2 [Papaver somniferum]
MMKFFSYSLLLVLILMLTITSQTTVTINNTSITTTTFSPMCAAAESTTIVSSKEGCSNELTELAVCLPYISSPPNNLTDEVPSSCCDRYISSYGTGYVTCLCHLVREPCLLGFPVDITRMFALSTVCHSAIPVDGISLEVLCEAILPNLRPLGSTLGSVISFLQSRQHRHQNPMGVQQQQQLSCQQTKHKQIHPCQQMKHTQIHRHRFPPILPTEALEASFYLN